jgi:predicted PurR-regulated permease PerM
MYSQLKQKKMKKCTLYLMTALMLWSFTPTIAASGSITEAPTETPKIESAEANILIARLEEIKSIDKSNMKSSEKRQLRKEVRSIKKTLTEMNGGVYLSVGAIIIIILLLILLL